MIQALLLVPRKAYEKRVISPLPSPPPPGSLLFRWEKANFRLAVPGDVYLVLNYGKLIKGLEKCGGCRRWVVWLLKGLGRLEGGHLTPGVPGDSTPGEEAWPWVEGALASLVHSSGPDEKVSWGPAQWGQRWGTRR